MGMSESKWLELKLSRKKKIFKWFVYEMLQCSWSRHIIILCPIQNRQHWKLNDTARTKFLITFFQFHVLVGTHILMELGDVSQFYFMCTVIKSLVNYICVGNNPSVSTDLTNVSISLTDLMSVSCVYFLKVHCFCDLKLFNPDQIK